MKVVDNFFDPVYFNELRSFFLDQPTRIPWFFVPTMNKDHTESNTMSYFEHLAYQDRPNSDFYKILEPIVELFDMQELIRIKCNCYPATENLVIHPSHKDYEFTHKGAIISINTCDGYTLLEDGTRVDSVANRVLFFDPSKMHSSTNCTNEKARFNINVNYL
jgi:hypothetical protein